MQFFGFITALLFGVLAAAAPMNVVWVTETDVDVVTVPMTRTVWVTAGETSAASSNVAPTWTRILSTPSTAVEVASSSAYVAPSSSSVYIAPSSSSVYVAPSSSSVYVAPSSSSVYVAPSPSSVYVAPSSSSVYVAPSPSSVYVAPTTSSSSVWVAPTTSSSSVYVAPTTSSSVYIASTPAVKEISHGTTSSAAAATSSVSTSSDIVSNGLTGIAAAGRSYTGDLTWYETGTGACGWNSGSDDAIVAISEIVFDNPLYATANPNDNPLCGQWVSITGKDGKAHKAKVVDRCTGCAAGDLDLSEGFFNTVTENGDGRVSNMGWLWL